MEKIWKEMIAASPMQENHTGEMEKTADYPMPAVPVVPVVTPVLLMTEVMPAAAAMEAVRKEAVLPEIIPVMKAEETPDSIMEVIRTEAVPEAETQAAAEAMIIQPAEVEPVLTWVKAAAITATPMEAIRMAVTEAVIQAAVKVAEAAAAPAQEMSANR